MKKQQPEPLNSVIPAVPFFLISMDGLFHLDDVIIQVTHCFLQAVVDKAQVENLGREVRRTCEYYLINKKDARFTHLVLAGGGANMAGLSEFLSEGMEMKVVVNDLRQAVTFVDKLDQRELKKYLGALTVAIGAALYGGEADD